MLESEIDVIVDVSFLEKEGEPIKLEILNFPFPDDIGISNKQLAVKINNRIFEGSLDQKLYPTLCLQKDPSLTAILNTDMELGLHTVEIVEKLQNENSIS